MKLSLKFILILGSILVLSHTRCIDAPISSQTYDCDADRNLTVSESTDLFSNFDTTDGKLTFELQFRITGTCSLLTPPYSIFVMTLPVSGTTKKIFDLKYEGSNGYKIYVEDASSAQTRATLSAGAHVPPKNLGWIRATFTWDISANTAVPTIYTSLGSSTTSAVTFSFASFALSDAMAFYFGSGVDGANPMLCEVKSLKLLYGTPVTDYQDNLGMGWAPALIGTYSLKEQSGYTLSSTSDSLGTGYLGSSTATTEDTDATHLPALISEEDASNTPSERSQYAGLLFTAQTQYITLPSFSFEEQLSDVIGPSFSINFWLRLSSLPASSNLYLFSYCQADGTEIFTVQVKTTGQFEATVLGVSLAGKSTAGYLLTTNTWNIIHIDFGRMDFTAADIKPYYVTITIDDAATLTGSITPGSNPTFDTDTDYIKMGALGIINNVRVFSPGAGFYDTPACDSTTCDFEAGLLATPVCVVPACASTCAACSDEAVTSCLACNSGFGLSAGGRCKDTEPLTCAADQYEDESVNACESCDSSCGSCSGPGQRECITCADSYDFVGPLCSPVDDLEMWVKLLIVLGIAFVVITVTYAIHIIGDRRAKSKVKFAPL